MMDDWVFESLAGPFLKEKGMKVSHAVHMKAFPLGQLLIVPYMDEF